MPRTKMVMCSAKMATVTYGSNICHGQLQMSILYYVPPDAVVAVSLAAWLLGAVP